MAGPTLANVTTATKKLPSRTLVYGMEGTGKTSLAAYSHKPIFLVTRGEDGLDSLKDHGLVPQVPRFGEPATTFAQVLGAIDELIVAPHDFGTLVVDTLNGVQVVLFEELTRSHFKGNRKEFEAWASGPKLASEKWGELLARLDRLREVKRMAILLLAHAQVENFKNPEGADYDRYTPSLDRKYVWPETARWLDMILFLGYETSAEKEKGASKAKATGGYRRVLRTEREAAFDAKNRHCLPPQIPCESGAEGWAALGTAIRAARARVAVPAEPKQAEGGETT